MTNFVVILKDTSDFGTVGLQGIHHVLENDRDIDNVLHSIDRDGFDRVFAYVPGIEAGSFDAGELRDLLLQLEQAGGSIKYGDFVKDTWNEVVDLLTLKQYSKLTRTSSYSLLFERALKVSKNQKVIELSRRGLNLCRAFGWIAD